MKPALAVGIDAGTPGARAVAMAATGTVRLALEGGKQAGVF